MPPRLHFFLANIGALALIVGAFFLLSSVQKYSPARISNEATSSEVASVAATNSSDLPAATSTTTLKKSPQATTTVARAAKLTVQKPAVQNQTPNQVMRIQNPYSFPPESFDALNTAARSALVNILCLPHGDTLRPISGSGVIIDPRGVILTNAHVAQYVLLSESSQVSLSCFIRTGGPATAHWIPEVLYIPPVWVQAHVSEITSEHPTGTGEHDYALLLIKASADGSPLPTEFPSIPVDTREAIAFQGDQVLAASYPAEFLGGVAAEYNLFPASSFTSVKQLLTFNTGTVDLLSLGGIIEAQSGSSGGAVVNAWGRLVGIISTTSSGDTTAQRDLRAVTLSYINTDLAAQTQFDLATTLGGDVAAEALDFTTNEAPNLISLYLAQLSK